MSAEVLFQVDNGVVLTRHESDIGVLSFLSKVNCASQLVLQSLCEALEVAEKQLKAVVIWQSHEKFFCAGADLPAICRASDDSDDQTLRGYLHLFQQASMALRHCKIPVVAAVRGFALGGGCEIAMHCDAIVAHAKAKMGLVEALVGLIPAGGGCKEMVYRAAQSDDYMERLKQYFYQIGRGLRANDATEAKAFHYLKPTDLVVEDSEAVLAEAKALALSLSVDYQAPASVEFPSIGSECAGELLQDYAERMAGQVLSEHDEFILQALSQAFCPGDHGDELTEQQWLDAELDQFMRLAVTDKSRARIRHMLETAKPLAN